ncbi:MAG: GIY-YIG nuclease family protein [Parcubacteria group bacterium]|nr:GIY-YIG nuclease family protein [Parcubacteria group bacterium]
MYTVYILLSLKDKRTYTGHTKNFSNRLLAHNKGRVTATKHRLPFEVLYTEKHENLYAAKKRELYWKSGGGRRRLQKFFKDKFSTTF